MTEIRKYRRADGVIPFDRWMAKLKDERAKARVLLQLDRLRLGLAGDWKSVGEGVLERGCTKGRAIASISGEMAKQS